MYHPNAHSLDAVIPTLSARFNHGRISLAAM